MYHVRYAIGALAAILVLAAIGLELIGNRTLRALLVTSLVVVSLTSIFVHHGFYEKRMKEDWRGLARYVSRVSSERLDDDVIRIVTRNGTLYRFYFDMLGREVDIRDPSVEVLKELVGESRRDGSGLGVWLITAHGYRPDDSFLRYLNKNFGETSRKKIKRGKAVLFELRRPPSAPPTS
jgi:hypothetical protein